MEPVERDNETDASIAIDIVVLYFVLENGKKKKV